MIVSDWHVCHPEAKHHSIAFCSMHKNDVIFEVRDVTTWDHVTLASLYDECTVENLSPYNTKNQPFHFPSFHFPTVITFNFFFFNFKF